MCSKVYPEHNAMQTQGWVLFNGCACCMCAQLQQLALQWNIQRKSCECWKHLNYRYCLSFWGFRNTFCHLQINEHWKNNIHRISDCHMYDTPKRRYSHPFFIGGMVTRLPGKWRKSRVQGRTFNLLWSSFCWGFVKISSVVVQLKQKCSLIQSDSRSRQHSGCITVQTTGSQMLFEAKFWVV